MKKFFLRIVTFFSLIIADLAGWVRDNAAPALHVTDAIKKMLDDPALDIVTALTATRIDDVFLDKARDLLHAAVSVLSATDTCMKKPTPEEQLACFIDRLRNYPPELRSAVLHKLASWIARNWSKENGLTEAEADAAIQLTYMKRKHDSERQRKA